MAIYPPAFTVDVTFLTPDEHGITRSVPKIERPARFWYGASLPFRVEESIDVLKTRVALCNFYEAIGIAYDVQLVLEEALEHKHLVDEQSLAGLQHALDNLLHNVRYCFKVHLIAAKTTQPVQPETNKTVQAWFDATKEFVVVSRDFATAWGHQSLWDSFHISFLDSYKKRIAQVIANGAMVDSAPEPEDLFVSPPAFMFEEYGPLLSQESSMEEVVSVVNSIIAYYKFWTRQKVTAKAIAEIRTQFKALHHTLEALLHPPSESDMTLKDKFLGTTTQLIYVDWRSHFHHTFSHAIQEDLASRQSLLEATTCNEQNLEIAERHTCLLASEFRDAAFLIPSRVHGLVWSTWAPLMLPMAVYSALMFKHQLVSTKLQHRLSASCEIKCLWFDLHKSLITTYMILAANHYVFTDSTFPLEQRFFEDPRHRDQFYKIISEPMVANPMIVEDVIAEYCTAIATARVSHDLQTANIRLYSEKALGRAERIANSDYHDNQQWNPLAMRVMQKMAVRLNHLTGGPGYIRRAHQDYNYWEVEHVQLDHAQTQDVPAIASTSTQLYDQVDLVKTKKALFEARQNPARVRFVVDTKRFDADTLHDLMDTRPDAPVASVAVLPRRNCVTTRETVVEAGHHPPVNVSSTDPEEISEFAAWGGVFAGPNSSKKGPSKSTSSMSPCKDDAAGLVGINYVSSFDYVNCPFPETRAVEVAISHQISRELADADIPSTGPRVEDVVNQSPRHTWTPGQISIIGRYLPYGPFDVLKALWQKSKSLKPARKRRYITSRSKAKQARHHDLLSPKKDSSRVGKTGDSSSPLPRVPRLRGGGARPPPSTNNPPSTGNTPPAAAAQVSSADPATVLVPSSANSQVLAPDPALPSSGKGPFIIWQDPSSRPSPSQPQIPPGSTPPAGNQDHEAQRQIARLRAQQGLPPQRQSANSSNQENRNPQNVSQSTGSASPGDDHDVTPRAPVCQAIACHRCPVFQDQYHHVCPGPVARPPVSSSRPSTFADIPRQSIELPHIFDISDLGSDGSGAAPSAGNGAGAARSRQGSEIPNSQSGSGSPVIRTVAQQPSGQQSSAPGAQTSIPAVVPAVTRATQTAIAPTGQAGTVAGTQSGTQTTTFTAAQASTPAILGTVSNRGTRRRGGRAPRNVPATTRVTRGTLAQINAQQPIGSPHLNLAQVQGAGGQSLLGSTAATPTNAAPIIPPASAAATPIPRYVAPALPATSPVPAPAPTPVTPPRQIRGGRNRQSTRGGSQQAANSASRGGAARGGSVSPPRNPGRRPGFWSASNRGSPTASNPTRSSNRADLTDPTANASPSPPPVPDPSRGQLDTARHPHDSSDGSSSGDESSSDDDSHSDSGSTPTNVVRPPVPGAIRPATQTRTTRNSNSDPFVSSLQASTARTAPSIIPMNGDLATTNAQTTAMIAHWATQLAQNDVLLAQAQQAIRTLDAGALMRGILLPQYSDPDVPFATVNAATDTSGALRRANSDRVRNRRRAALANLVGGAAGVVAPATTAVRTGANANTATGQAIPRTRQTSNPTTRGEKRSAPDHDHIDADLRRNRLRGGS